jgi:hypothetical protein
MTTPNTLLAAANKIYEFDRYHNGKLMAESAKVTKAINETEAYRIAKSLFPEPDCKDDVFVLVETLEAMK